jgi:hypothetical protein
LIEEQREREVSGRVWPRATPSSSMPSKNDKEKRDCRIPGLQRDIPSRSSPSLGRFAKGIRNKERYGKGLGNLAKIQIQI